MPKIYLAKKETSDNVIECFSHHVRGWRTSSSNTTIWIVWIQLALAYLPLIWCWSIEEGIYIKTSNWSIDSSLVLPPYAKAQAYVMMSLSTTPSLMWRPFNIFSPTFWKQFGPLEFVCGFFLCVQTFWILWWLSPLNEI
jgi:hypothetical protein